MALRSDYDVVREAVRNYGFALQYALKSLRDDRSVAMVAWRSAPGSLEYASTEFRADRMLWSVSKEKPLQACLPLADMCRHRCQKRTVERRQIQQLVSMHRHQINTICRRRQQGSDRRLMKKLLCLPRNTRDRLLEGVTSFEELSQQQIGLLRKSFQQADMLI